MAWLPGGKWLFISQKDEKHYMTVLIYLPNQRQGAVPMFFGINFKGNHAIHPDEGITLPSEEKKLLTYGRKYMFPRGNAAVYACWADPRGE